MKYFWLAVVLAVIGGCGDDQDCASLCSKAQAGDCTAINGDCGSFCAALDRAKSKAGCTSQADAYVGCLSRKSNVCDSNCGSEEGALATCMTVYCLTHASDSDCKTLIAAFQ